MTNISVPRDLLERIVGKCKLSVLGDDHAEVWKLLSAPAVEGELEALLFLDEGDGIKIPLCSLPKAQAIIDRLTVERDAARESMYAMDEMTDQQAARIAELQKNADRYRWLEANSTYGIDYRQRPELTLPIYAPDHHEGLGAAIDKAMKGEGDE